MRKLDIRGKLRYFNHSGANTVSTMISSNSAVLVDEKQLHENYAELLQRLELAAAAEQDMRTLIMHLAETRHPGTEDEVIVAKNVLAAAAVQYPTNGSCGGYALIYDSWDYNDQGWTDDSYENFSSPEEAIAAFQETYDRRPGEVANPRVVKILYAVPGDWNRTDDTPTDYDEARPNG